MSVCMYVCIYVYMYICIYVCQFSQTSLYIFLRKRTMRSTKTKLFRACSARERDFLMKKRRNFEDAPHGSAISFKLFRMLRTGARFPSKFSGCSPRRRDFLQNFEDAPHGSAISFEIFRMLRTGARFSSKFSGRSARERDFLQNKTTLSGAFWYRIGIGSIP